MERPAAKKIVIGVGVAFLSFVLLFFAWRMTSRSSSQNPIKFEISDFDWTKGKKDANLTLIEYSDFQCPACASYQQMAKQLVEKYQGKLLFVYRHFPLTQHKNAKAAAYAAEAAGRQGQFWMMHDTLFENQSDWEKASKPDDKFVQYAKSLKLDVEKFQSDSKSSQVKDKVDKDLASGIAANVNATPTFYLNGIALDNPRTLKQFEEIITEKLESGRGK